MKSIMFVGASLGGGGSERVMTILANAFSAKGYKVSIIRLFDEKKDYPVAENILTEYIGNNLTNPITKKIKLVKDLRKKIKQYNPDTIVSFLTTCNVISVLAAGRKKKVIISERNDPNNNVKTKTAAKIRNIVYIFADCLVCQTEDAVSYFPKKIQKNSTVIENPINEHLPMPYDGKRGKSIIMVCRLNKQKNIPMALKAFDIFYASHKEWTLDIYGEGAEKDELLKQAEQLNSRDNIIFHGFSSNVADELRMAGVYLSTSDYEGISNSMLEALAMGVPCVVTDCPIGGAKMVIRDGKNGLLIPVNDVEKCAKSLKKIVDTEEVLSNTPQEIADETRRLYSEDNIIHKWKCIIDKE